MKLLNINVKNNNANVSYSDILRDSDINENLLTLNMSETEHQLDKIRKEDDSNKYPLQRHLHKKFIHLTIAKLNEFSKFTHRFLATNIIILLIPLVFCYFNLTYVGIYWCLISLTGYIGYLYLPISNLNLLNPVKFPFVTDENSTAKNDIYTVGVYSQPSSKYGVMLIILIILSLIEIVTVFLKLKVDRLSIFKALSKRKNESCEAFLTDESESSTERIGVWGVQRV